MDFDQISTEDQAIRYLLYLCCTSKKKKKNVFLFCCRKSTRKTQVEEVRGAGITECREGANGQMPSNLGGEKGVALPGTPVEWFTVKQKKEDANNDLKSSSK